MKSEDQRGLPARAKLWIASIDQPTLELRAQYNPKELQIDKQIPWNDPQNRGNHSKQLHPKDSEQDDLGYNCVAQRTMQIELLFDGYEQGESVQPDVDRLEALSSIVNPRENEELRRPHHCLIGWGPHQNAMPPFRCVIESLSTKYTMWDTNGTPLRATCTIKVKEAEQMSRNPWDPEYSVKERGADWDRVAGRPRSGPFQGFGFNRRFRR